MSTLIAQAWTQCFIDLGTAQPSPSTFDELRARYSEPHRAYHTLQHLDECMHWFNQVRLQTAKPGEIAFALFYHDAIYDTHAKGNEERSAELANRVLREYTGVDTTIIDRIESLVLATRHDALPRSKDEQVLVDIDLAILGAPASRFDEYEQQVRLEYAWIAADAFREGRSKILRQFQSRESIYATPFFHDRLEAIARANLARSLRVLTN